MDALVPESSRPDRAASPRAAAAGSPAVDSEDITASITELQNVLLDTESIERFVHELAVQAASLVAGSLSCGITMSRAGQAATVACSDEVASQVNDLQYRLREGPCLTALEGTCQVRVDDMAADTRWPRFTRQAADHGIQSCLSVPLIAHEETVGALNLYALTRAAFGPAQIRRAERFAQNAAGALALGLRLVSYSALTDQLRASLASRAAIDQAVGVIMAQERCTQDTAFATLRATSQNRNVKLRDVAREVVASVTGEGPHPPPFERG
jgi:transcriptional regulator with GAF, ATPase, and Fis domain